MLKHPRSQESSASSRPGRRGSAKRLLYERTTRAEWESVHLALPAEYSSMGVWLGLSDYSPADLDGSRLDSKDLDQALRGEWPSQTVQNAHGGGRFMGWDWTFSVPKAVAMLYAATPKADENAPPRPHRGRAREQGGR